MHGIASEPVLKMRDGRPNIADAIVDGEITVISGARRARPTTPTFAPPRSIRKVPYITTLAARAVVVKAPPPWPCQGRGQVKSLQSHHADIFVRTCANTGCTSVKNGGAGAACIRAPPVGSFRSSDAGGTPAPQEPTLSRADRLFLAADA